MIESGAEKSAALIPADELKRLLRRSDRRGLARLIGHLAAIIATGTLLALLWQRGAHWSLIALATLGYGFTLVTMFAAMHECVHHTAFASAWLNRTVGWAAGLLSFYNSTFYRHYHTFHHRFTQIPGKDPELDDPRPTSLRVYAIEMSGITWWLGKLETHAKLVLGRTGGYPFLNESTAPAAVRSVRLQLAVYLAAIGASLGLGQPLFVLYWLLPMAAAQPLLRVILLAEHTGCSTDANPLTNTRTTHTLWPVRFLMWEMPYHAEHHRYPALPFFALRQAHGHMGRGLAHVAQRGYLGLHAEVLKGLMLKRVAQRPVP